jgi:hypothetical protein
VGGGRGQVETMEWERLVLLLQGDNLVMHGDSVTRHAMGNWRRYRGSLSLFNAANRASLDA